MRNAIALILIGLVAAPLANGPQLVGSELGGSVRGWMALRRFHDAVWRGDDASSLAALEEYSPFSPQLAGAMFPMVAHTYGISHTAPVLTLNTWDALAAATSAIESLRQAYGWLPNIDYVLAEETSIYGMRYLPLRQKLSEQGYTLVEPIPEHLSLLFAAGGLNEMDSDNIKAFLSGSKVERQALLDQKWRALAEYASHSDDIDTRSTDEE